MSRVLTIRIEPGLLAQAEARAARLGLDRAGYVRNLIQNDLKSAVTKSQGRFASEDLVGAFRLCGKSATNQRVRQNLKYRAHRQSETNR